MATKVPKPITQKVPSWQLEEAHDKISEVELFEEESPSCLVKAKKKVNLVSSIQKRPIQSASASNENSDVSPDGF